MILEPAEDGKEFGTGTVVVLVCMNSCLMYFGFVCTYDAYLV